MATILRTHEEKTYSDNDELIGVNYDADIVENEVKVGYITVFETYSDDETLAYLATIEVREECRNKGIGTAVIKQLTEEYGELYLCPENERCESLYERLGEELDYRHIPEQLQGCYDEYGKMYLI